MNDLEILCPKCGSPRTYRMKRYRPPFGEQRMCEGCWRPFDYQTPEEQARTDQAAVANKTRRDEALEKIRKQLEENAGKTIDASPNSEKLEVPNVRAD